MQKLKRILFILLILPKVLVAMPLAAVLMLFSYALTCLIGTATIINDIALAALNEVNCVLRQINEQSEDI